MAVEVIMEVSWDMEWDTMDMKTMENQDIITVTMKAITTTNTTIIITDIITVSSTSGERKRVVVITESVVVMNTNIVASMNTRASTVGVTHTRASIRIVVNIRAVTRREDTNSMRNRVIMIVAAEVAGEVELEVME